MDYLLAKTTKLEHKLKVEKADSQYNVNKMNDNLDIIRKVKESIRHLDEVVNKSKLFDSNLVKNPICGVKVINVLVDFGQKMEEIFDDMRSLFERLDANKIPFKMVPNISTDNEMIPMLNARRAGATKTIQMPKAISTRSI